MNIWAIVAVIAALIFGICVGYLIAYFRERKHIDKLLRCCKETSDNLAKLSTEYDEFVKAAHEVDRWPKHDSHIVMKDNLAEYLKQKYLAEETDKESSDWDDCEDEPDNLYV